MKNLIFALLSLIPSAVAATCGAHGTPASMVVTTKWLADHHGDKNLVVIAIGTEGAYKQAHIPGSVYLDYRTVVAGSKETLTMELPAMAVLAERFAALGVTNDSHIVLYYLLDENGYLSPTGRVYMTLDAMGFGGQTSLLDGHMVAWKAENRPMTTEAPTITPGKVTPCDRTQEVIANLDYVKSNQHSKGVRILDARSAKAYETERIEGAGNVFFNDLIVESTGKLKPVEELKKMFTDAGVKPGDRVVTYCFIGQQASALYTVARYLGYDARLFDGSMDEWNKKGMPVVRGK